MIWPFRRKSKKRMARIVIDEPITSSTRVSVLKALKQIEDREFPASVSYTHLTLPTTPYV